MKLALLKGTKDYLPGEQIVRERIKAVLKGTFERYGFSPLETPVLEMRDVLASKYAGGAEILKEMFNLTDQGRRALALRYDLTVPLARVIGMNPSLRLPLKRYEIGRVFRDGPVKLGRYREFTQCDVDVVGSSSMFADAELIALALSAFLELGLDVVVEVNNRKILSSIMRKACVPAVSIDSAILVVDKLKKIGRKDVIAELVRQGVSKKVADSLLGYLTTDVLFTDLNETFKSWCLDKLGNDGVDELSVLCGFLKKFGVDMRKVRFNLSLARGLEIYTGPVFEVFLVSDRFTSALAAGGRYDKIIGAFLGSQKEYPAVGLSFGLDAIFDALSISGSGGCGSVLDVFVIPIKTFDECLPILNGLRNNGVKADIDFGQRSISRNLDFANKEGIPYVMIVGQKELEKNLVKLKDMVSGKESLVSLSEAIKTVKR